MTLLKLYSSLLTSGKFFVGWLAVESLTVGYEALTRVRTLEGLSIFLTDHTRLCYELILRFDLYELISFLCSCGTWLEEAADWTKLRPLYSLQLRLFLLPLVWLDDGP